MARPVPLETLNPGDRFEVAGVDRRGILTRLGNGTATVRYDGQTEVEVNGKKFMRPNAPTIIAPRTEVFPIHDDLPARSE
jgi:hypothetical protein